MKYGVRSDKGLQREKNEDSYSIVETCSGLPVTFIIADGMGGHNSGEIASNSAVDFISTYIRQHPEILSIEEDVSKGIQRLMQEANEDVYSKSKEDSNNSGMGTTLIVAVIQNNKMFIGHVGDSRAYFIRDGVINRITTDHSFIEELIKTGSLTREEAENHPQKNLITRAVGYSEDTQIDMYVCDIEHDDLFVLCTDGLTNMLSEDEIKEIVYRIDNPEAACVELIRRANECGGEDNITVIVIRND